VRRTIEWYRCAADGASAGRLSDLCASQIAEHSS